MYSAISKFPKKLKEQKKHSNLTRTKGNICKTVSLLCISLLIVLVIMVFDYYSCAFQSATRDNRVLSSAKYLPPSRTPTQNKKKWRNRTWWAICKAPRQSVWKAKDSNEWAQGLNRWFEVTHAHFCSTWHKTNMCLISQHPEHTKREENLLKWDAWGNHFNESLGTNAGIWWDSRIARVFVAGLGHTLIDLVGRNNIPAVVWNSICTSSEGNVSESMYFASVSQGC